MSMRWRFWIRRSRRSSLVRKAVLEGQTSCVASIETDYQTNVRLSIPNALNFHSQTPPPHPRHPRAPPPPPPPHHLSPVLPPPNPPPPPLSTASPPPPPATTLPNPATTPSS